jgi:DNA-binding transcriptional regulator YdaS (Cro superfamily)
MTLTEYFIDRPRGARLNLADRLGVSYTWLCLVANGKRQCSPFLAKAIEKQTRGLVKRQELRPDIFGSN